MTDSPTTPFTTRCDILAELWIGYKSDSEFQDFIRYNDLGLPLAYAISTGIVEASAMSETFINESFDLFLAGYDLSDDGYESLDDIIIA